MEKLFMVLVLSSLSLGAVIIETQDGADPVSAGFSFAGNGTYSSGAGNDGEAYWFVNSNRAAYFLYTATAATFQDLTGWTATWRTKTLLTNSVSENDNLLCVRDGGHRWDFSVCGGTETRDPGVYVLLKTGYVRIDSPAIDVSEYHTYQIVYDPATQSASYYIDGDVKGTYLKSQLYTTTLAEMRWGDQYSTTSAAHENRYALARLETGQNLIKWVITGSPSVVEGGATGTYSIKIGGQPSSAVTVTVTADAQLRVNGVSQTQLVFDPALGLVPQTVTVSAFDDGTQEGSHSGTISHTAASADAGYNFAMRNVIVAITDNDVADRLRHTWPNKR